MPTYKDLKAKADELLRQAERARKSEIGSVVKAIRDKMVEFGITIADLKGTAPKKRRKATAGKKRKVAPKYRDPATGQTWSGRGKVPRWLAAYIKKGKKKDDFKI